MARVNHKLVKQRLNEKRSSITDRQFFSSRILAGHFEDIATAQTKRYKYNRRVRVNLYWNSKDGSIACTNNEFTHKLRQQVCNQNQRQRKPISILWRDCLLMNSDMYCIPIFSANKLI